jgi:hypothetical protein
MQLPAVTSCIEVYIEANVFMHAMRNYNMYSNLSNLQGMYKYLAGYNSV